MDVDRTLSSSKPADGAAEALRLRVGETFAPDAYRLTLRPDLGYELRVGQGEGAFAQAGRVH